MYVDEPTYAVWKKVAAILGTTVSDLGHNAIMLYLNEVLADLEETPPQP